MSGGEPTNSDTSSSGARIDFNYNASTSVSASGSDKTDRAPLFNGDSILFPFWKTNMYSHIIGISEHGWRWSCQHCK
ncbi:hypothetical protein A2U01_0047279 [Trifolium medium]|uniref:Uncharacterized protein n=1 Tax=Trifolium medium TaxID=97028 RepID=A0A392QRD6_9FABA|nr:hypothetical protein [Trifolium medium]